MRNTDYLGAALVLAGVPLSHGVGWPAFVLGLCSAIPGLLLLCHRPLDIETEMSVEAFRRTPDEISVMEGGRYIFANPAALLTLGLPNLAAMQAKKPADFTPEFQPDGTRSADRALDYIARAERDGRVCFPWIRRRTNGQKYPVEITLIAFTIRGKRRVIGFYRDTSDVVRSQVEKQDMVQRLAANLQHSVRGVAEEVRVSAKGLNGDAEELSASSSQATDELCASTESASAMSAHLAAMVTSTNRLSASLGKVAHQVRDTQSIIAAAAGEAADAANLTQTLEKATRNIGSVVQLIANISEQTKLLALNASIEAARAGEAGRGFGIVANEVKALALQTAEATGRIQAQIRTIQEAAVKVVGAVERITVTARRVNQTSEIMTRAVEEQDFATQDIAGKLRHVAQRTDAVSTSIVAAREATSSTRDLAGKVASRARSLSAESDGLTLQVDEFRTAVLSS